MDDTDLSALKRTTTSWSPRFSLRNLFLAVFFVGCVLAAYRIGEQTAADDYPWPITGSFVVVIEEPTGVDRVATFPVTGNETVLDAIASLEKSQRLSDLRVQLRRSANVLQVPGLMPTANSEKVLDVDIQAIAEGRSTATNYQLLPRDRLIISRASAPTNATR